MNRLVSAPTTLPCRTRYTVVDAGTRRRVTSSHPGTGGAQDEEGQFGDLDAGPEAVAGQPAGTPRQGHDPPGPSDQRARRNAKARGPVQGPAQDEHDSAPQRSDG